MKTAIALHVGFYTNKLTINKEYDIIDTNDNKIVIIDDNGNKSTFYKNRFKINVAELA